MVRRQQHKWLRVLFKKQIAVTLSLDQSGSWDEDTKIPGWGWWVFFFLSLFFLTPETSTSIWWCWPSRACQLLMFSCSPVHDNWLFQVVLIPVLPGTGLRYFLSVAQPQASSYCQDDWEGTACCVTNCLPSGLRWDPAVHRPGSRLWHRSILWEFFLWRVSVLCILVSELFYPYAKWSQELQLPGSWGLSFSLDSPVFLGSCPLAHG